MPRLAESFLRDEMGAVETGFKVATRDAEGHVHLHVWGKVPGRAGLQVIDVYATNSSDAFECLAAESGPNSCDIGMSSRRMNDSDKGTYPTLQNLRDRASEHVVAYDGIAIIVNPRNPVTQLSLTQVKAIYKGEIRNWKDVGGNDASIEVCGRDRDSGEFGMFTENVISKDPASTMESAVVSPGGQISENRQIADTVMRSPNAIGYVPSTMIRETKPLAISDGSGPAILPTEFSIATGDYPICRPLFLYNWDAPGSVMDAFVRYVVYKPGQAIVTPTAFVELPPRVFPVLPPRNAPARYKEIAFKYSKIGLNFYFSAEQTNDAIDELDSLARVNVHRLRTFLSEREMTGSNILLIGFSDGHDGANSSKHLAQQRAEEIAISLRAVGVVVPSENILNFGEDLPVASNDTPEGRRRNRRVEVWVRNGPQ